MSWRCLSPNDKPSVRAMAYLLQKYGGFDVEVENREGRLIRGLFQRRYFASQLVKDPTKGEYDYAMWSLSIDPTSVVCVKPTISDDNSDTMSFGTNKNDDDTGALRSISTQDTEHANKRFDANVSPNISAPTPEVVSPDLEDSQDLGGERFELDEKLHTIAHLVEVMEENQCFNDSVMLPSISAAENDDEIGFSKAVNQKRKREEEKKDKETRRKKAVAAGRRKARKQSVVATAQTRA